MLACLLVQHLNWADVHLSHETLGQNKKIVPLTKSSKLWRQDGRHWVPDCLLGSGCEGEQWALSMNLHRVTWLRDRRRINYIYKSLLLVFFLHQANINTSQTEKHRISNNTSVVSLHHSIREIHQNNNNQNNICFFHYQNTLSKRFIETERILHHCKWTW